MSHESIKLNIREITPPSIDDELRREQPWEKRTEDLLKKWAVEMEQLVLYHHKKAVSFKKLFQILGLPSTLIPIIVGGLNFQLREYPLVMASMMITSGVLIGITNFINPSKKSQLHYEFENKYDTLARSIQKEMGKKKFARIDCDVYLNDIYLQYSYLNDGSPH